MLFKDKTIAFVHRSAETLKLTYQSTLQTVQLINLLDHYAHSHLNALTQHHFQPAFPTALLSLCCKLHEVKPVSIRDLAKLIHPNYRHFCLQQLQKEEDDLDQPTHSQSLKQLETEIKEWEVRVMLMLKWKLSVPLLYDQVLKIAFMWDKYTSFLQDFPIRFEAQSFSSESEYSNNHNFLASRVCICVYNLSHLIKGTALECVSAKCRKLALALFAVLIRQLMREKYQLKQYVLSPKYSVQHMLQDFYKKELQNDLNKIKAETDSIVLTLENYKAFKELSREKERKKGRQDKLKKKRPTASQKISEEKENLPYYISCKSKQKKRSGSELNDKSKKNHSRSRKDRPTEIKEVKTYWLKDTSKVARDNHREPQPNQKEQRAAKQLKESTKDIKEGYREKQVKRNHKELGQRQPNQNGMGLKEKPRLMKPRGSVMKVNKKKSSSTKSIVSKNVSGIKKEKPTLPHELRMEKVPFSRSRASKRSDKSQLNSKLVVAQEEDFTTKSTYWLRSTTLAKTDKKSTNSSTRMKLR